MDRTAFAFALEVIARDDAKSLRLKEFLSVYANYYAPEFRTEPDELINFLDRRLNDRHIIYYGLTSGGKPCGFATFMCYSSLSIGIIDYMIIAPNMRSHGAFFNFFNLIELHLNKTGMRPDYLIAEVMIGNKSFASEISPNSLARAMGILGFRVAVGRYWIPHPFILSDQNSCRAVLLIKAKVEQESINIQDYIRIVELIFRVHYGDWYEMTMQADEFKIYKTKLETVLTQIIRIVRREKQILLRRPKNVDLRASEPA